MLIPFSQRCLLWSWKIQDAAITILFNVKKVPPVHAYKNMGSLIVILTHEGHCLKSSNLCITTQLTVIHFCLPHSPNHANMSCVVFFIYICILQLCTTCIFINVCTWCIQIDWKIDLSLVFIFLNLMLNKLILIFILSMLSLTPG